MNKVLVPLENQGELARNAALFAMGFAQRTGAQVLFLRIQEDSPGPGGRQAPAQPPVRQPFPDLEEIVSQSRQQGLQVGTYLTRGDYVRRVGEFVRQQGISRIVVALPAPDSQDYQRLSGQVAALRRSLSCPLVVVRPRAEGPGPTPTPDL